MTKIPRSVVLKEICGKTCVYNTLELQSRDDPVIRTEYFTRDNYEDFYPCKITETNASRMTMNLPSYGLTRIKYCDESTTCDCFYSLTDFGTMFVFIVSDYSISPYKFTAHIFLFRN